MNLNIFLSVYALSILCFLGCKTASHSTSKNDNQFTVPDMHISYVLPDGFTGESLERQMDLHSNTTQIAKNHQGPEHSKITIEFYPNPKGEAMHNKYLTLYKKQTYESRNIANLNGYMNTQTVEHDGRGNPLSSPKVLQNIVFYNPTYGFYSIKTQSNTKSTLTLDSFINSIEFI